LIGGVKALAKLRDNLRLIYFWPFVIESNYIQNGPGIVSKFLLKIKVAAIQ